MVDWRKEGYHILKLPGFGEIHLEISGKARDSSGSTIIWEALVHCREDEGPSLRAVLHIFEESLEDLLHQVVKAFPGLLEYE